MKQFYLISYEYDKVRGPLFSVKAKNEKEARARLRFRLGMGRCPNKTKVVSIFNV
jgi:hypothetical protein